MIGHLLPALALGIKHSFDADHLLAVSNFLIGSRSPRNTLKLAINWTIGHMAGAGLVTVALFLFRGSILTAIAGRMDLVVGAMLIVFGALGLCQGVFVHSHQHTHRKESHAHAHIHLQGAAKDHSHRHIMGVGILQGLASNDELLLLLTVFLGLSDIADMIFGVAVFSAGVFIGMIAFGLVFSAPILAGRSLMIGKAMNIAVGILSIIAGLAMLA
ncbi:MAG: hypothetical protein U0R44_02365 [Candidatus Micrarchaeia archaeon]